MAKIKYRDITKISFIAVTKKMVAPSSHDRKSGLDQSVTSPLPEASLLLDVPVIYHFAVASSQKTYIFYERNYFTENLKMVCD